MNDVLCTAMLTAVFTDDFIDTSDKQPNKQALIDVRVATLISLLCLSIRLYVHLCPLMCFPTDA